MARAANEGEAVVVGASDHCGWAVLVTVDGAATLIDRRRVELVDASLPSLPHHHEGQMMPVDQAVQLIERVAASAHEHAATGLDALAAAVPNRIAGIALRRCPALPPTIAERLTNYRAQNVADTVMYRNALAAAATAKGWQVAWYDVKTVFAEAARARGLDSIDRVLADTGAALGPPWRKDHKLAMAAAIAAMAR